MELLAVKVRKPDEVNFILGMSHFIKTVEDIYEACVSSVPGIRFGLAFCESSGAALVRLAGTDQAMMDLARENALAVGAGHSFFVFLAPGFYPINVLPAIKSLPEVCRIFCATANPAEVIVADTGEGRAILGVADGMKPRGVEDEEGKRWRHDILRKLGYKL